MSADSGDPERADREQRLARLLAVLHRFSIELTASHDRTLGTDVATSEQTTLLCAILRTGRVATGKVADLTGLSRSAAARLVDHLATLDLVERVASPTDRRSSQVVLTATGRRRAEQMVVDFDRFLVDAHPLAKEMVVLLERETSVREAALPPLDSTEPLALFDVVNEIGLQLDEHIERHVGTDFVAGRQRGALLTLFRLGDMRAGQLAEELGLTSGGLTYVIDRLESAGLIIRRYGSVDEDRRAVIVSISDRGRDVALATIAATLELAPELDRLFRAVVEHQR